MTSTTSLSAQCKFGRYRTIGKSLLAVCLVVGIITLVGLATRHLPSWQWVQENERHLREQIEASPWVSLAVGIVIYSIVSLVPGTSGKSVIFGWLFGFWFAVLIVEIGLTVAASISFFVSRWLLRHVLRQRWRQRLHGVTRRFEREGAYYLLLLRLAHTPFTLVNYTAGATQIPLSTFAWTTALGLLPGTLIFTFAGTQIPTLAEVAEEGAVSVLNGPLLAALGLSFLLPVVLRSGIRYFRRGNTAAPTGNRLA